MADHVVIIGGGPGGYEAAHVAAQLGAEVTVVDTDGVGGSAVLTDCVPSKTLIATAELMTDMSSAQELGVDFDDHEGDAATTISVDLAKVNARVKQLAADQSSDIAARLDRDGVRVVQGRGRIGAELTVAVTTADGRGDASGRRDHRRHRRRSPHPAVRAARRRADPHLGAGLRPRPRCRRSSSWSAPA